LLNTYVGSQETIAWQGIVDPSLDVNDVVYVKSIGAKVDRLVILDTLEIPLDPGATMTAKARTVRVVSENEEIVVGA
jgi:hypothetical protein